MQNFLHGVKGTDVEPGAVSFHWYTCYNSTISTCTSQQWRTYAKVTTEVRGWIWHDLGHLVPLGISEWNFDPGSNNTLGGNKAYMTAYTRTALSSMIAAKLDFAAQFDTQDYGGYGALDMFDVGHKDRPKAQFMVMKQIIARYRVR